MSHDDDTLDAANTRPEYMWLVGYEHLIDSMRTDTRDTYADQARAAQNAALMFASAQARALTQIADRLAELVEQQKIANGLTATGRMGVLDSDAELLPARRAARKLLGLGDEQEGRPE
ncbi:hypothetical protein IU438_28715 [Nocardia cyriacigeorgica]|uniref:hypothetical protein n=1 Tax=Nocardia cyriacigeorgica TaxID=135487 RepID=UPI001895314B|nr:hypothetical protein [Nocardia cyriacigeorgica]MBF6399755.1 hypothetical protein [Nocardia cyriacigeorgica]MBF6405416.1 hypothetical protein [Nocardia cyriacigeorgica]